MQLKKPKVKVKKTTKPKTTQRIVTKMKSASMPDIQLPELSGVADGLNAGLGGFDLMPDLNEMTLFGGGQTIGNDFVGTFYDFKRDRTGRPIPMDPTQFSEELRRFCSRWVSIFSAGSVLSIPKEVICDGIYDSTSSLLGGAQCIW